MGLQVLCQNVLEVDPLEKNAREKYGRALYFVRNQQKRRGKCNAYVRKTTLSLEVATAVIVQVANGDMDRTGRLLYAIAALQRDAIDISRQRWLAQNNTV